MEILGALLSGFDVALKPLNLLWGFIGVTLGTAVGVLPGVGPALTVAMLLPLTVKLDPTGALISVAVFLFFVKFLNVNLPAGWLAPLLGTAGI